VLNLGGVGNVTWIGGSGELLAFDTGPGNALIDDWCLRHLGRPLDEGGRLARSGRADAAALDAFAAYPYFHRAPPKSLDRDDFRDFATHLVEGMAAADGAATLTAFTAVAVALAAPHFPAPPGRWLVCGGGRHNAVVMEELRSRLEAPVDAVEAVGWDGDALEAQAFAFLAVRSLRGLPLTFPGTTGAPHPLTGGVAHRP
jgi:anhydro-N-acetylmuramic acid kinase